MVESLSEAVIYKNQMKNGILPVGCFDSIFNFQVLEVDGDSHRLKIQDMNSDIIYYSEPEVSKKVRDFLSSVSKTPFKDDLSIVKSFFEKFIEFNGKILMVEYKNQNSILVNFQLQTDKGTKASNIYTCVINKSETSKHEQRDKTSQINSVLPDLKDKLVVSDSKVTKLEHEHEHSLDAPQSKNEKLESPEEKQNKITMLLADRQLDEALALVNSCLDKDNSNIQLLESKAEILNEKRLAKECLEICSKILELNKGSHKALAEKALALRIFRKTNEAIESIDLALKLDPKNERYYYIKSFVYNSAGKSKNEMALSEINKALKINPNYSKAVGLKALIYSEDGSTSEALVLFDKAIMLDPKNPENYNFKGLCLRTAERYEEAAKCFAKATEVDPNFSIAWDNLGDIYLNNLGKTEEAIKYFNMAIEKNPLNTHAFNSLAKAYWEMRNSDEALKVCERAIQVEMDYPYVYDTKGQILVGLKKYDEALEAYQLANKYYPENKTFITHEAYAMYYKGEYVDAYDRFCEALDIDCDYYDAIEGRDMALRKAG